jgi:hypothetical protein
VQDDVGVFGEEQRFESDDPGGRRSHAQSRERVESDRASDGGARVEAGRADWCL